MQYSSCFSRLAVGAALIVVALPHFSRAGEPANIVSNSGAEAVSEGLPADWLLFRRPAEGLRMWRDTDHARSGTACLAIANQHDYSPPVSNNWGQDLREIPAGKVVRLTGWVRTEDAEAANICLQCWGANNERIIASTSTPVFRGTHDWELAEAPDIVVPPATTTMTVRAALTGKGKVFFDDLSVTVLGPPVVGKSDLVKHVPGRIVRSLPMIKDCMILAYLPQWDHGDVDNLGLGDYGGGVRTLLAWEPPSKAELAQPGLRFLLALYCRETQAGSAPIPLRLYEITTEWAENTSWEKQPQVAAEPIATCPFPPGPGWKILDVTSAVRALARAERPSFGVLLRFGDESRAANSPDRAEYALVSREGLGEWESRRPTLLVADPSDAPASAPASSPAGSSATQAHD